MTSIERKRQLQGLAAHGFDQCRMTLNRPATIRVSCSQCEALVINGIACHETGCPNATHECKGCNEQIPIRQTYCQDCM